MTDSSVYILLADGFEELEAIAPADILRRMELSVVLVGVASKQVRGSHGIEPVSYTHLAESRRR